MSQANDAEANGPTDVGPRPGPYEGVKLTSNVLPQQTTVPSDGQHQNYQQLTQQPQNSSPRPAAPIRRTDSRTSIPYRPPIPNQPANQYHPQPINLGIRPNPVQQLQSRPPPPGGNISPRVPIPRFPHPQAPIGPGQPNQPQFRPQYDPQLGQEGNFRRAVNAVFQRPPHGVPRAPGIYTQRSLPQQGNIPSEPGIRKSLTLDNSDVNLISHSAEEQNGKKIIDNQPTMEKQKYDDVRSTSSLGLHDNEEKDLDISTLNGKLSNKDDIIERPESRTGHLSKDHSLHSSMQKIDEDDDDAVVIPSRTIVSGSIRSGKSSMSNSSDNISQKSLDLNKPDITKPSISPDPKKTSTPPKRNSSDNVSVKSLEIEPVVIKALSPLPTEHEEVKKFQSPVSQPSKIPPEVVKPINLIPQEKISRTPSPITPNKETPKSFTPDQRQMSPTVTSHTPVSPVGHRNTPSPARSTTPISRKTPSPRVESKNILSGRQTPTSKLRKEGDNDSGVDESMQGNDRSLNGDQASPKKTPHKVSKLPSGKCKTPTKMLQSPKSPDPANSIPPSADKKKLPMNKIQVGSAPSPNIKQVKSKIGSLDNASYKPGGGKIKLENKKIDFSKVQPKIAAKNEQYIPGGGDKKKRIVYSARPTSEYNSEEIQQQKLQWNAKSKIGSLENATYKPGGGDKKIENVKLDFKDKAKAKVGSKDNIKHTPGGGDVKSVEEVQPKEIETKKIELNVSSKIGSLDNVKYRPGGGDVKIFDDKDYLKQKTPGEQSVLSGSQSSLRSQQSQPEPAEPVSDENLNQER